MRHTIGKEFTFDAAHVLPLHDGKCNQLHGHTYRVLVVIAGPLVTEGPKQGMVMDFGDIKAVWKEHIEPLVDHQYLNKTLPVRTTTAEEIARWMVVVFQQHIAGTTYVESVTVWETPTAWAMAS